MHNFLIRNPFLKCFRYYKGNIFGTMSGTESIQRLKKNADVARKTIEELKLELELVNKEYNNMFAKQLIEENAKLTAAVEEAKKRLIQVEVKNGIKQIPVPNGNSSTSTVDDTSDKTAEKIDAPNEELKQNNKKELKAKKEKKPKEPKEQKEPTSELPVDIGRLDLRIGKVEDVQRHPDADSLYVLNINCGEERPRTVCSGLVKHVPIDELKERTVVVLCNLKPVKMRGITSEAMVMCASSDAGVEVLNPPQGSQPGDLVHCTGYTRQPDSVMNPKKKIFETVAPDLHTNDKLEACYKNTPLVVEGKGVCLSKSLKNVPVK